MATWSPFFLFPRHAYKDYPIPNLYRISRDIDHGGHLHHLPRPHIEFRTVTGADDIKAFQHPIPQRTVIVRADIADGKELVCDIENDDGLVAQVNE